MSDQTPGTPQNPPTEPPAQPAAPVDPGAPAAPAAPAPAAPAPAAPAQAAPAPAAAQPTPPPAAPAPAAAAPAPAAPAAAVPPPPVAAPAAPGAPGGPAYGSTPGAPPPAGGYFKSGKTKTIALIVGGVVAVGVIGGVAALLAGGGDDKEVTTTAAAAPEGSGVLDPAPVENTDPAPAPGEETTAPPTPTTPTEPTPTEATTAPAPTPAPEPPPAPSGDSVVIGGNVTVPVPSGWEVFGADETLVAMGQGSDFIFAITGTVKPSADAGQVLSDSLESVLPPEQYPDLRTSDVLPQQPGGAIVSLALLEYEATWTDGQGTVPVHGAVFSAVRQDGTALIILGEHSPPKQFMDSYEQVLAPIISATLNSLAGLG